MWVRVVSVGGVVGSVLAHLLALVLSAPLVLWVSYALLVGALALLFPAALLYHWRAQELRLRGASWRVAYASQSARRSLRLTKFCWATFAYAAVCLVVTDRPSLIASASAASLYVGAMLFWSGQGAAEGSERDGE